MLVFTKKHSGLAIVALLIVIVVIAILATISVVAYNGIQDRTNDSAVKADLCNFATRIEMYYAEHGEYPVGGGNSDASVTALSGITFMPTKNAYQRDINNFYYCGVSSWPNARYAVAGLSKSGNRIAYYNGSFQPYSGAWSGNSNICPNLGIPTTEAGYSFARGQTSANLWNGWIR